MTRRRRASVIAEGANPNRSQLANKRKDYQVSYDLVADEYVRRIFEELQHKPVDRQLLDRFGASVRDVGPACDMGCDPGHVARYLHERGGDVCGVDLSPAALRATGFEVDEIIERDPYPEVEHQSWRAYIFARRRGISR